MTLAALAVGAWVSSRIEDVVVRNTANATALYMESFIAPLTRDMATHSGLSEEARTAMEKLFTDTALGRRVVSYKIWQRDGLLVEASNKDLVGQHFALTENLALAWEGQVRADFEELHDPEDVAEAALEMPLLEIYSPVRLGGSDRVIAVAEVYEVADTLKQDLIRARLASWGAVALVMAAIGASLFAIVLRGSRTIDRQLLALRDLSDRNTALRLRVQGASARVSAMQDRTLRRIGADLHDGAVQLLGFAALRLDAMQGQVLQGQTPPRPADLAEVETAVREAITDLRGVARGLSLPDADRKPLRDLLQAAIDAHAARTGSAVVSHIEILPERDLPPALKTCLYRFVQEGLNNAWHHAGGQGQEVRLTLLGDKLRLSVLDKGPGFAALPLPADDDQGGMGLAGLADRVQSLGGTFQLLNRAEGGGAELRMTLDVRGAQ